MATLEIEGRKVEVDDSFKSLSPEDQAKAVEEIAAQIGITPKGRDHNRPIGQVNAGIANTLGGVVDFLNPLDDLGVTGSAKEGLRKGMLAMGADVATEAPRNMAEGFGRGVGDAAALAVPMGQGLQALRGAGGMVGQLADDLFKALSTTGGVATDLTAAGIGRAASQGAGEAGAPQWVQDSAEILVPGVALPAMGAAAKGTARAAGYLPGAQIARRTAAEVKRALVPMTEGGAREVAAERLRGLAGGEERAAELARRVEGDGELGLTPAQQTGDPNMIGLEQQAKRENPALRERIDAGLDTADARGRAEIEGMGGDVADARSFFDARLTEFKGSMQGKVDQALQMGRESLDAAGPRASETTNSNQMVSKIKDELANSLSEEARLWAAVPRRETVETGLAKSTANRLLKDLPRAQQGDFPRSARQLLIEDGGFGDKETVAEMHGLYSELRRFSRSAMAGNDQNKNAARIANEIADAILMDLGKGTGRELDQARAYSRALHETFDQGAVGRILKRTIDGDEALDPDVAMRRTVGRGGADAKADAQNIEKAAPGASGEIQDYLRGRFMDSAISASDGFTPKKAREWMRQNREALNRYPDFRAELTRSLRNQDAAIVFSERAKARMSKAETDSAAARFGKGQDGKAVQSIIGADSPASAARSVMATARKDPSGKAVAGVKAAFTDYLIGSATAMDGTTSAIKLNALMADKNILAGMKQVFSPQEIGRLTLIGRQMAKAAQARKPGADVGAFMDSPTNKLVEFVVRIAAAKHGGSMGGGSLGGSIQTANIATERAQTMLRNLTNTKARQLLMDAIEDPELFKALLMEPRALKLNKEAQSRLAPYLAAATSNAMAEDE